MAKERETQAQEKDLVQGDEALARGALAAGVRVVTGYPGSPATGVFDSILAHVEDDETHVQWSPNEKVAMETAIGASIGGSRTLVILKSVGMSVGLDPLATVSLSGCNAGFVILLGDDPGAWASQNEQDSRWSLRVAEVPVVEPLSVAQAAPLMHQAFAWSESLGMPVVVRVTRALTVAQGPFGSSPEPSASQRDFLRKRNRWIALPYLVEDRHRALHQSLRQMQAAFEASPYNVQEGQGEVGIIAVGYAFSKLKELLQDRPLPCQIMGLSSTWPLPEERLAKWAQGLQRILVLEENGPFVEQQVRALAQRRALSLRILGREEGTVPTEGELDGVKIAAALQALLPDAQLPRQEAEERRMPSTVPLCDDCPYRPTFDALIAAMERNGGRDNFIVIGETGCMVRANLPPMELFDIKYSLGSGLGIGLGVALSDTDHRVVAILGDSSFFHSDIPAMPRAVQLNLPMLVIVLDNDVTALTGGQVHPGSTKDERGVPRRKRADLVDVIRGCGVEPQLFTPHGRVEMEAAFDRALSADDLQVIIARGPCPRYIEQA
ncbi:MAG: thiamine pyrophosphate-dependent enzyme [Chloroflexota bacterium]|nr:thiamine pyrophosphate-dependent enzyme [Chloroflexota bacterium]